MSSKLANAFQKSENQILSDWLEEQMSSMQLRRELISERQLHDQSALFLRNFVEALQNDESMDFQKSTWFDVKSLAKEISQSRANQGFSPTETATFVFSLKSVLFKWMQTHVNDDVFIHEFIRTSELLDKVGLYTTDIYLKSREEIIKRQQTDMLELSTPVVELAQSIIALPLIGTLDSHRAQTVMETLLEHIVKANADIAIIDITGVPTVDTLVAQHLMKTVAAARLMGADCIISGIRPQIAQTIVQLGLDLGHIHTKASLADAFKLALKQRGMAITVQQRVGSAK